ncbi:MAG TPA: DNRLRE domain-containing protein [Ferruginibacter sp.]|nr:DNRLRE domain-containing protein [Ferruginibacter sp.]
MKQIRFSIISLSLLATLFTSCQKKCDMPATVKVDAGTDQTIVLPVDSVTLTGTVTSGSTSNTAYLWSVISGPSVPTFGNDNATVTYAKNLVQGTYVLQFQATNNAGTTGFDTTTITVEPPKTIILQPGAATGQDAEVVYVPGLDNGNNAYGTDSILRITDWTYFSQGYGEGWTHAFVKFMGLNNLPAGSVIKSAKLSLYGLSSTTSTDIGYPEGDNYYSGSPYPLSNEMWLQRATADWDQTTITYNNEPAVTSVDEVATPTSTSQFNSNITDLDVTQLVKDMVATPGTNYGFSITLQTAGYYRSQSFYSSEGSPDSSLAPKLVITFQ